MLCCNARMCVLQGIVGSSTDMDLLWAEVKAARELVFDIETLRQGQLGDMAVTVTELPQQVTKTFWTFWNILNLL